MTKPWNTARAAQHRRPRKRSVFAPVGSAIMVSGPSGFVPYVEPVRAKSCGHHTCSCDAKPALAKQTQPTGEWTWHKRCAAGWEGCWHLKGSALHVNGEDRYAEPHEEHTVEEECFGARYCGTLEGCKTWVEQHERDKKTVTAHGAASAALEFDARKRGLS